MKCVCGNGVRADRGAESKSQEIQVVRFIAVGFVSIRARGEIVSNRPSEYQTIARMSSQTGGPAIPNARPIGPKVFRA